VVPPARVGLVSPNDEVFTMPIHRTLPALALALALGACDSNRERANPPGGAETGALPADTTATAAAPAAPAELSDANIVALLDHANAADSTASALAASKATNPEVKQFAKLMMTEHHALRKAGADLAKKLNVTPEPPANDPVTPLAEKETQALQSAPKGAEFDRTYIDQEITAHEAVLDLAKQGHDQADNPELKALIEKAQPVIEKHLDQAKKLQQKLQGNA
jgi:putative membrane protein